MTTYEGLPSPKRGYDIEFLEALRFELDIALSTLDMDSGIDKLTDDSADFTELQGEELDKAIEHLHEQVSQDPINAAKIAGRTEELLRLKRTIEALLPPQG